MALRHAAASAMLLALLLAAAGLTGAATQQAPEQWRVALPPPPPLQAAHARAAPPAASDPVRYWLYHLQVAVPRYSFKKLGVNFTLSDVVCTQIELGKISSTQSGESYSVAVSGLGVTCAGQWRGTSLLPAEKGTLAIGLGNSSLALGVQLTKDNDGLAIKATAQGVRSGLNVTELAFEGAAKFIEDILHKILPELAKDLTAFLNTEATKLLTSLIDKDVTQLLTGVDDVIRPYLHPGPPPVPPPVPPGMADLRNSSLLQIINYFVDDVLGGSGNFSLNHIVDLLTDGTGSIDLRHLQAAVTLPIPGLATISLELQALAVDGLDSWGSLALLDPVARYLVDTHSYLDRLGVNLTFAVAVNLTGSTLTGPPLLEVGAFHMRLDRARLDALAQLAVDATASRSLKPAQLLNGGCLLSVINDFNLTNLALNFTLAELAIDAGSGGSTEVDLDVAIDRLLALFTSNYAAVIPAALNGLLVGPVRRGINQKLAAAVANASCPAPGSGAQAKGQVDYTAIYAASGGACALFVILAVFLRRAHAEHTGAAKRTSDDPFARSESQPLLNGSDPAPSLSAERSVSTLARYLVPLGILSTIAIFIYSNTSDGASVYPEVTLGSEKIRFGYLFTFTLGNSVRDMWRSEVYALSLLIGVFSGAWPYLKLVLMLFCWAAPVRWLPVPRRETFLQILDALGKWSLIDTYVMVMMLVAFRFHLPAPGESGAKGTAIDIYVQPQVGIHTFIIATISSLVLTHVVLHMHRRAAEFHDPPSPEAGREALSRHHFTGSSTSGAFQLTWLGSITVTIVIMGTMAIVLVGAVVPAFSFNFKGLAGWAMQADQLDPVHNFSLISLGNSIPPASPTPNELGIRWLQSVFFLIALAIPVTHLASLLFIWNVPLRTSTQTAIFHVTEVLNAWAGLDVFVIALLAAVLEIQRFAQFIVGGMCDPINVLLAKYFDKPLDGDDKCFDVTTTLNSGCWLLFIACVIHILVSLVVMRLCQAAIHQRKYAGRGRHIKLHTSRSIQQSMSDDERKGCCGRGVLAIARSLRLVAPESYSV